MFSCWPRWLMIFSSDMRASFSSACAVAGRWGHRERTGRGEPHTGDTGERSRGHPERPRSSEAKRGRIDEDIQMGVGRERRGGPSLNWFGWQAKLWPSQTPGWPLIPGPFGDQSEALPHPGVRRNLALTKETVASPLIPGSDRLKMRAMPHDHRTDHPGGIYYLLPAPPPPSPSCTHTSASSRPPSGQHLPCPDQKPWPLPPSQRRQLRGSYLPHTHTAASGPGVPEGPLRAHGLPATHAGPVTGGRGGCRDPGSPNCSLFRGNSHFSL